MFYGSVSEMGYREQGNVGSPFMIFPFNHLCCPCKVDSYSKHSGFNCQNLALSLKYLQS